MNARARLWIFLAMFGVVPAVGLPAQTALTDVAREPAVELPTYTVTDSRELPPPEQWLYAHFDGFEILSNASTKTTRALVGNLQRFAFALDLVWPAAHRQSALPVSLIICGRGARFDAFRPSDRTRTDLATATIQLRDREAAAIVVDAEARVINLVTPESLGAGLDDPGMEVDADQQLNREYIHFLLGGTEAPLPPWLTEGLAQIFMKMDVTRTSIAIGKIEDPNLVSAEEAMSKGATKGPDWDRDFNGALKGRGLLPMAEMFAMPADAPEARNAIGSTWAKQCYAFVHWCLYGENAKHQQEFLTFVTRLGREPLTEDLFKECFKMNYRQMGLAIRGYIDFTAYRSPEYRAKKGQQIPEPPPFELREATQAEVGRIKGDALRLAGHEAAAHLALIAPYMRGEHDPQLLAALGLQEHAMGDDARARKFLEAAARAMAVRATAYLELARLRLAEAVAQPGATGGKLSGEQTAAALGPLFTARGEPPPLPEVYETIAEVWDRSATMPTADHLAVLDEGVRLFPRNATLVYRDAELNAKIGLSAKSAALVDHGLRIAPDAATRERFEALRATLPASAPPVPSAGAAAPAPTTGG